MIKEASIIKRYIRKLTFLPDDEYRILANKIRYFYEDHNNKFDVADFYTYISQNGNEEVMKTLDSIINMDLNDKASDEEIEDYFNVIDEYNIKNEIKRIENEIKADNDINSKKEKLKKLLELKLRLKK